MCSFNKEKAFHRANTILLTKVLIKLFLESIKIAGVCLGENFVRLLVIMYMYTYMERESDLVVEAKKCIYTPATKL